MAKDPAFLFYYDRFLAGTFTMTDAQVGQYVRLMCIQANKGFVTYEDMMHICKSYDVTVFSKFEDIGESMFANKVLQEVVSERKAYTESRRNNRKGTKSGDKKDISNSYDEHMVNIDKDVNINEEKDFGKSENLLTPMEINATIEYVSITGHVTLTKTEIEKFWTAYLIHAEGQFHNKRADKIQHFRNWLKKQSHETHKRNHKNDTARPNTTITPL